MLVLMIASAQNPISGYVAAGQDVPYAGLMTLGFALVFVGWVLFTGVREVLRMRREEHRAAAFDFHTVSLEGLGTTMADGGEPAPPDERKGREQTR